MAVEWFDPRELLARLGARSPVMIPSPRDVPTPPPTDIAGALGMVRNQLGRELMCHLHCGGSAQTSRDDLHAMIRHEIQQEHDFRTRLLATARAEQVAAEDVWATMRAHSKADHSRMEMLRSRVLYHKGKQFPDSQVAHWHMLRSAVLAEMACANLCRSCEGRGHSPGKTTNPGYIPTLKACPECGGNGRAPVSDRQRAEMLKRDESSYRKTWSCMYEWTFNRLSSAETEAVRQFWYALTHRERGEPMPENPHVIVEFVGDWGADNLFGGKARVVS